MNEAILGLTLIGVGWSEQVGGGNKPPAEGIRVEYTLKTPRSREPVLGGTKDKVYFNVWIPPGVKTVRGGICNPFSRDDPVSAHWKAVCRHWQFAYVQTDFDAVKKDEFALIKSALADLAKKSGHAELANLPLCFLGMSRGGGMSMQLAELMPERTLASVPVCLEVGPKSDATRRIPVLTVFGEKDGKQMSQLLTRLPEERKQNARFGIAVQRNRGHEFGQANNLAFVFLDDVINRRLPKDAAIDKPVPLQEIRLEDGWLGDPSSWGKDGKRPTIQPWKEYKGDRDQACWFPSHRTAAVWQAFVAGTKDIVVSEPAGLGDGQKFVAHVAAKPINVTISINAKLKPAKIELWDGDKRIAERSEAPWSFEASLKPGVHSLFATVTETGAITRTSRPHTIVVSD